MKVGDKVLGNDGCGEFTGWIASIDDSLPFPYSVVKDAKDIGKTFLELGDSVFEVYELEYLTLLKDGPRQYCNLTKRELKMVQSELNDAYAMLQNRDNKIKELERELNIMKQSKNLIKEIETMTNIEKVNKALENADESKIKEVLDFLGYKEDSKFIPEKGEMYYLITGLCNIISHVFRDNEYDNHALLMNNVYRTEEEAKQALDYQTRKAKLIKEIEDSSDVIDWSNEEKMKHYIWLDGRYGSLRLRCNSYAQTQGAIYTTNEQFLEELIVERSGEVKELLFGIKS